MGGAWQLLLGSAVISAIVSGLVGLPKMLADRNKSNAEADGERFGTYRDATAATITELQASCARCSEQNAKIIDVLRKVIEAGESRDEAAWHAAAAEARKLI